jgi:hypothetical protein
LAKLPSALTLMAIQTRRQLLAELGEAGLDEDELDLLRYELELDPGADDYDESDNELTSEDDRHFVMASSSTVHASPPPPPPKQPPARAPAASTVPQKRKCGTRKNISPEIIDDDEGVAGSCKHDCMLVRRVLC